MFTDFFFSTHTVNIFIKFDYREKLSENERKKKGQRSAWHSDVSFLAP